MARRQQYTIDEIKDMLLARVADVAYAYAPPAGRHYVDKGRYFTLNPGRADKSVGSFYVHLTGPHAGKWRDHAAAAPLDRGDILDLIGLGIGRPGDAVAALKEARNYLGLQTLSPEDAARRRDHAAQMKRRREEDARRAAENMDRQRGRAHRLWLSGIPIANTPAEAYLRDRRGIDLRALGHQPGALRFVDRCFYTHTDPETGEVIEGHWPALVAIVNDAAGRAIACHRIYLALAPDGIWDKAPLPEPKKAFGPYAGGWISIWKGRKPTGTFNPPLSKIRQPELVYVAEGIEDALSAAYLVPEGRHLAAISLSNMASLALPDLVTELTFVADLDENDQARAQLQHAIATHRKAGRKVRLWQNRHGGKDLNDALKVARERGVA